MVIYLPSIQLNFRTSPELLRQVDEIVSDGIFRNRTEALNAAVRELVRKYRLQRALDGIEELAAGNKSKRSLSKILEEVRREDDRFGDGERG